ncbi:hypothetical protein HGP14_30645 [Rhizobium sp. P32RR-XVIII]|uniref:hypothetical protein n=1 Tax=Rhizobium sp. P32RR-XVIII TaxID=2726738 RepID=UPI00145673F2|nr:hypothetical protein [Rhizobium sp. P32RR-XVIII]NLS07625.1 hypothetical protein [Rhizobium sp. P32RR-XVIII]
MKLYVIASAAAIALSSCSAGSAEIEPIPGSITYGGHVARLTRSPPGSTVPHEFDNQFGNFVQEVYIVQPDRTLKLVRRKVGQKPDR